MKKQISILLLLTLFAAFLLGGCTKNVEPQEKDGDQKTYKFGIISQIENGAFLDMRDGVIAGLENAGYTE